MAEFVTSNNNMEDGSMCLMVKTFNNTGMNKDGYDYLFMGAEMDRPASVTNRANNAQRNNAGNRANNAGNRANNAGNRANNAGNRANNPGNRANNCNQFNRLTYDELLMEVRLARRYLNEMTPPFGDVQIAFLDNMRESETHFLRRRYAGFLMSTILEEELIQLRDRIEEMESIIDEGNIPMFRGDETFTKVIRILEDAIVELCR